MTIPIPPPLLFLLGEAVKNAAQAFGSQMAAGVLEALLHQASIDFQLKELNRKLDLIIEFLYINLPEVLDKGNDRQSTKEVVAQIYSGAITLSGTLRRFEDLKKDNKTPTESDIKQLVVYGEACFDRARILATYGQVYYDGVILGILGGLLAYQKVVEYDPTYSGSVKTACQTFVNNLYPWIDPNLPGSLKFVLNAKRDQLTRGKRIKPLVDSRYPFAISWTQSPPDDNGGSFVIIFGGWWGYEANGSHNGNMISHSIGLKLGEKFEYKPGDPRLRYLTPSWWTVVNRPASRADYDLCGGMLFTLTDSVPTLPSVIEMLNAAVNSIELVLSALNLALQPEQNQVIDSEEELARLGVASHDTVLTAANIDLSQAYEVVA